MAHRQTRWLRRLILLLVGAAALAASLIAVGIFDPRPLGPVQWEQTLSTQTIPAEARQLVWLDHPLPAVFSLRLTAAYQRGETDVGYGLALGDDSRYLAVAVSPLGYVSIWQTDTSAGQIADTVLLPWQSWPHVRTGAAANELWLDAAGGQVTVHLNREWLWTGPVASVGGRPGVLAESFGAPVVIDFQMLQLFAAEPG